MDSFYDKSEICLLKSIHLLSFLVHILSLTISFLSLFYFYHPINDNSSNSGPKIKLVVMSKWEHGEERSVARSLMGCRRGTHALLSRYSLTLQIVQIDLLQPQLIVTFPSKWIHITQMKLRYCHYAYHVGTVSVLFLGEITLYLFGMYFYYTTTAGVQLPSMCTGSSK